MMSASGDRFDWYQSEDNIWIDYLRKKMAPTDIRVEIKRREVSLYLTIPTGDELLKKFQLLHEVVPEDSSYRVTATKIEIKLKKADKVCWSHLESQDCITGSGIQTSYDVTKIVHSYPSSSKSAHDWNKIDKEAAEIEGEEDPLNKLFRNIYENASDETRRAMIKSFTESAGTVLSTNWSEVGAGKVEIRPPDGMEYKKYEI
ncbi:unnamed protein product [Schistosoma bovis]|uniref:Suppressor of G2 allele of SKP1 n=1 Tax=Schistosoma bovis TaxID=6184 RepID=A0A430Q6I9_SCHBO|nr:suppressor of G2 allele of SKP1 [Schistosoma bovis]CAH8545327.1 unnamed protein product [Schistosoma bovis]